MTTVMKINELETTDVMVGKTAAEQLLLLPSLYSTAECITAFYQQSVGSYNGELELIIEHQNTLMLRDKCLNHTLTINTLTEVEDLNLDLSPEILNNEIIDISTISTKTLSFHNIASRSVYNESIAKVNKCISPLDDSGDVFVAIIPAPFQMGDVVDKSQTAIFSILRDEQVTEFDTILAKIKEYLPEGYVQQDDEYLVTRTKSHCYVLNKFTDKLIFIGEYTDEFLEKSKLLVSDVDVEVIKMDREWSTKEHRLTQLKEVLQLSKDNAITMEEVIRMIVQVYG